jgi:hypothetical protein
MSGRSLDMVEQADRGVGGEQADDRGKSHGSCAFTMRLYTVNILLISPHPDAGAAAPG